MTKPFRPLKAISITFTVIIVLLAFPTAAIMATWNAIPGSTLYPIKRSLEKTALALLPNSFYEIQLRLKLIDRRTTEITASLIKSPKDMKALNELLAEAKAAQFATTSLEEAQERSQAIQQLIAKLTTTNQALENIKTTTNSESPSTTNNSPSYNNQPQTTNSDQSSSITNLTNNSQSDNDLPPTPSEPDPPPPQPDDNPANQITNTQDQINNIIDDLEQILENPSAPAAAPEPDPEPTDTSPGKPGQSQGKHKGQNKDDD